MSVVCLTVIFSTAGVCDSNTHRRAASQFFVQKNKLFEQQPPEN